MKEYCGWITQKTYFVGPMPGAHSAGSLVYAGDQSIFFILVLFLSSGLLISCFVLNHINDDQCFVYLVMYMGWGTLLVPPSIYFVLK